MGGPNEGTILGCTDAAATNFDVNANQNDGSCIMAGCDGIAESGLVYDACGICDGDSSSCEAELAEDVEGGNALIVIGLVIISLIVIVGGVGAIANSMKNQ